MERTVLREVNGRAPCVICGGDHKCARGADGLILCGRHSGPQPGFVFLGPCTSDPTWHLYREENSTGAQVPARSAKQTPEVDWANRLRLYVAQFGEEAGAELSRLLGLPAAVFSLLPVGFQAISPGGPIWFFPERDAVGEVIGLQRRFRNGEKRNLGQRGLCLPNGWREQSGPIFCVEGASDTLALTALKLSAVGRPSNSGGVTFLAELLADLPGDRPIVVVGENDERASGTWPGRDGAVRVAADLTRLLRRPIRVTLPPDGHKDVRAWVKAQRLDVTCSDEWAVKGDELSSLLMRSATVIPEPGGLFDQPPASLDDRAAVPEFPVRILPDELAAYVRELSEALGCPLDFVGVPLLVLAGAALGNAWRVMVTTSHGQHAALFAALVGVPGSAKSPALAQVAEPMQQANCEWMEKTQARREQEEELGIKSKNLPRRCVVDDFTAESLAPILQGNPKGVAVVKDELAGLIYGLNQYKGGRGSDRQGLLSVWAGSSITVDRKSASGPIVIPRPFVAVIGGIQPSVLNSLRTRSRQVTQDDGLLDRFLFAYPELTPSSAESWRVLSEEAQRNWEKTVTRLLSAGIRGRLLVERRLPLSESGRREWQEFTGRHAEESNALEETSGLHGAWSKMRGYAARLALIVQALRWASGKASDKEVDGTSVKAGSDLVDYFKAHARKVHSVLQLDPVVVGAEKIRDWLAQRPGLTEFTRATLYQSLRRQFHRPGLLDDPLGVLLELHYLAVLPGSYPVRFLVNPRWDRSAEE